MKISLHQASIILAFYNDVQLLRLALDALKLEADATFEVLIADDGSAPQAVEQIECLMDQYPFPIKHLWHPDDGFAKTVILNRAVLEARGNTLIFLDADCIPQQGFVTDHLRQARPGLCLVGRRINVFREAVDALDCRVPNQIVRNNLVKLLWWSIQGKANHVEHGIRLPAWLATALSGRPWGILGCNFSLTKADLLAVNGFDERHRVQWGAEDSDLQRRLSKHGIMRQSLVARACMIHFDASFFSRKQRASTPASDQVASPDHYAEAAREDQAWTPHGIVKTPPC